MHNFKSAFYNMLHDWLQLEIWREHEITYHFLLLLKKNLLQKNHNYLFLR